MKVIATRDGFYNLVYYREGQELFLNKKEDFSVTWHKLVLQDGTIKEFKTEKEFLEFAKKSKKTVKKPAGWNKPAEVLAPDVKTGTQVNAELGV